MQFYCISFATRFHPITNRLSNDYDALITKILVYSGDHVSGRATSGGGRLKTATNCASRFAGVILLEYGANRTCAPQPGRPLCLWCQPCILQPRRCQSVSWRHSVLLDQRQPVPRWRNLWRRRELRHPISAIRVVWWASVLVRRLQTSEYAHTARMHLRIDSKQNSGVSMWNSALGYRPTWHGTWWIIQLIRHDT